ADNGRVEDINSNGQARKCTGCHEERCTGAKRGEDGGGDEEGVRNINYRVAAVHLGKGSNEKGASSFSKLPDCHQKGAACGAGATVVKVRNNLASDGNYGDAGE